MRNPVARTILCASVVDEQREDEEDDADHEERAVMDAAADHLAHLLRDDAGHRVHRLEDHAEPLGEIGNRDAIARAEQHDHRLADDAPEAEQDRRDDAGQRSRHDDAHDGLQPVRAERVGGFLEARGTLFSASSASEKIVGTAMSASRQPAVRVFSRSLIGKPGTQLSHGDCDSGPQRLAEHGDAEETEHDRRNGRDELDVGLDEFLLLRPSRSR